MSDFFPNFAAILNYFEILLKFGHLPSHFLTFLEKIPIVGPMNRWGSNFGQCLMASFIGGLFMKAIVSLVGLTALMAGQAFGQEASAEKAPEKKIDFSGILQGKVNLMDSRRSTTPDYSLSIPQLNVKVSEGIAKGQLDLRFTGNDGSGSDGKEDKYHNNVLIRKAEAGIDLPSKTGFRVGRVRPGNPAVWGADITTTLDGYGGMDGLMLKQEIPLGEGGKIKVAATLGNNLVVPSSKLARSDVYGEDTGFYPSFKKDKAMVASLDLELSGVKAGFYYGAEKNQVKKNEAAKIETTPTAADPTKFETKSIPAKKTFADVTHLEASLGYDMDGIGAGVAYQLITTAKESEGSIDGKGKVIRTTTVTDKKKKESILSLGMNGDSTLFGVKDLVQTGDKLTYALSYAVSATRAGGEKEADKDKNEVGLSFGYGVGAYNIDFNYAYTFSKAKQFTDKDESKADAKKNFSKLYLNSVYNF